MNLWVTFKNPIMISKLRSCSPAWSAPTKGSQNSWAKLTAPLRGRSHCPSLHWCTSPPCSPCFTLAKFLALQHRAIWLIMPVNSYSLFCCALFLLLFFFFSHFCKFSQLTVHSNAKTTAKAAARAHGQTPRPPSCGSGSSLQKHPSSPRSWCNSSLANVLV